MKCSARTRRSTGFTLIELMVTVAVVAVFASLAGPSFRQLIATQRVRSGVSALSESLWLARSEALKRNASVSFTVTNGVAQPWSVVSGATTLLSQEGLPTVRAEIKSGGGTFTFDGLGYLTAGAGKVQMDVPSAGVYRCITVSTTGRTTVESAQCT